MIYKYILNKTIKNSVSFVWMPNSTRLYFILMMCILQQVTAGAQTIIKGRVADAHSDEAVPFASITFKGTKLGTLSDSVGAFTLSVANLPSDTLLITSVGFKTAIISLKHQKQPDSLFIKMERGVLNDNVVVRVKIDKGLWLWRKIVQHKPQNDRYRFDNFSYELYNKLEVDLKNFKSLERVSKIKPFRPINDLINMNIDTSEGIRLLPTYLTESLSNYYYQKKPLKRREEIIAANTNGIKNESIVKFLGGMDQVFNVYNNNLTVFTKNFVSPISDNGDFYYKYYVTDTQQIGGSRYFHLTFEPRRKGMNTFTGDCWVHVGTFAIKKMNLFLDKAADVNFLEKLSFTQEFGRLADSSWFVTRERLVVDVSPVGNKVPGVIGRKTSTYNHIVVNNPLVVQKLNENKEQEEIITIAGATEKNKAYWDTARHEPLSKIERGIVQMIDTLINTPGYKKITKQVAFLATGYFDVGNVQLGSAFNWFSGNGWEGFRTRFDVASNKYFDKKLRWHTYLAYGFGDKKFKGEAELFYLPKKVPRQYFYLGYKNDLDFGQTYYGEISQDNIFSFAVRKPNIPLKFINKEAFSFEFFNELRNGFSTLVSFNNIRFTPLKGLPNAGSFDLAIKRFITSEVGLRLRFAFEEKFLESQFFRTSLGSPYPIVEAAVTKAFSGFMGSRYSYTKLLGSVSDYLRTPPFGALSYQLYAGKTFGTAPYVFLNVAPGNEMYYYNKYAFNMMNRFEFIHDRFAGINFEHNIGNGIFRLLPKLKFRQFYTAKALWGTLSAENKKLNFVNGHNFQSLNGKTYLEIGTGIDNILRVFRIDFVWRLLPKADINETTKRFGIFGSLRFDF